jgi:threonylcarbamoyladenosine tRNA methylthiotransferase MtaB
VTAPRRLPVAFRTLGCKVNQVESERIAAELLARAFDVVAEEDAAVIVVNTCTVTAVADRKARKEVRRALALPQAPVVVVTGCLASLDASALAALGDRVVVEADKSAVASRVSELLASHEAADAWRGGPASPVAHRARAQVKVEDGCDAYCAYCIVPYARGVPRAVPLAAIVAEVEALVARGTAEVVLTGINIGRYHDEGADLADVVRAVAATGVRRVRLSSIEPLDVPGRLLTALAETPAACPHLHVPLQSGADSILKAMDRSYDTQTYARILADAREAIPGLAVTTDVMAGFPGETPAHAVATRQFVESCGFMRLHVFRYSRRPGTLAAEMPQQVDPRDKRIRAERLRELGGALAVRYAMSRLGGTAEVLVERMDGDTAEGTSEDYLKVRFPARDARVGHVVPVTLDALREGHVAARW